MPRNKRMRKPRVASQRARAWKAADKRIIEKAFDDAVKGKHAVARLKKNKNAPKTFRKELFSLLGRGAQEVITKFGDYKVSSNTLMTGGCSVPMVVNSLNRGGFIVRHREYLGDILASVNFDIRTYPINPGMSVTFPWLSAVAQNFEQYKMRGCLFEFKSLSSDSVLSTATSSALGAIVMATQYDVLDPIFPNKFNMENYEFANSAKPSLSFLHPIECARSQTTINEQYIRSGAVPTNADPRLYDLGNFSIASVGMQATSGVAGELWVTYEVELYKPKLGEDLGINLRTDHFSCTGTINLSNPFGSTTTLPISGSTIGGTITGGSTYNFPETIVDGYYAFFYENQGTNTSWSNPGFILAECEFVDWIFMTDGALYTTPGTTGNTNLIALCVVQVTAIGASIALGITSTIGSFVAGDVTVTQINDMAQGLSLRGIKEKRETTVQGDDGLYNDITLEEIYDILKRMHC